MKDKNEVTQTMQNNQPLDFNIHYNLRAWQNGTASNTNDINNSLVVNLIKASKILGVK